MKEHFLLIHMHFSGRQFVLNLSYLRVLVKWKASIPTLYFPNDLISLTLHCSQKINLSKHQGFSKHSKSQSSGSGLCILLTFFAVNKALVSCVITTFQTSVWLIKVLTSELVRGR